MTDRRFTVEAANALLPELEGMLKRLRGLQREARGRYEEMRNMRQVGYTQDGNLIMRADHELSKKAFDQLVRQANDLLAAIHALGCRVTDVELGLVDFPADLDGQPVFLCWQLGGPAVAFYHGVREGYAGRRPLPPDR